jgi:hypothetical protein
VSMRRYGWIAASALLLTPARRLPAEQIEVAAFGVAATNAEVDETREARGLGFGAGASVRLDRFLFEGRAQTASVDGEFSVQPDYAINELALQATYLWRPALGVLVGIERRFISPDLAAQEVGLVKVGVRTETPLSRLGRIRAHAAYLPVARFSGGGGSSLGLELGLGIGVGPADSRFGAIAEFVYQRIDRDVNDVEVPIQYSATRLGGVARW